MAQLLALRGDRAFSPSDLETGMVELRVPPPGNVSRELGRLKSRGQVMSLGRGVWSITPIGRQAADQLVAGLDAASLERAAEGDHGAEFARVEHTIIPWWAAPPRWQVGIRRLLADHPFDTNVFCMTRFPTEGAIPDPVERAIEVARATVAEFGLTLHVASQRLIEDDVFGNVGAYMWACKYGIGFLEDRLGNGLNYNAVIELGSMTFSGRRVAILKDVSAPERLPTDLAGQVYRSVDLDDGVAVAKEISQFLEADLRLRRA